MTDQTPHTAAKAVQYWYDAAVERRNERDQLRAVVARIAQMADAWEERLPETIRTPAVVSALRAALEPAVSLPPATDQTEPVVTVHAAPNLSPEAAEALGALVDVAKKQAVDQTARRDRYAAAQAEAECAALGCPVPDKSHPHWAVWRERGDAVMAVADAELQAERERLFAPLHRAEADNAELRARAAELEQAAAAAVGRPDLRDLIAGAIRSFDFSDYGLDDVSYALEASPESQEWVPALADAVVAVLPADQRAATLREAADIAEDVAESLRKHHEFERSTGALDVMTELRRVAGEEPHTTETPQEDPARIDRLRPEFTEHSSVESIDVQLRRARSQERRWHIRTEWLIGLRQRRTEQQARGEWPAASAVPAAPDTDPPC